jgi:hypothetical protein
VSRKAGEPLESPDRVLGLLQRCPRRRLSLLIWLLCVNGKCPVDVRRRVRPRMENGTSPPNMSDTVSAFTGAHRCPRP